MDSRELRDLFEVVPVATIVVGPDGRVVAANAATAAMFGHDPTGRPFVTVVRHPAVNRALDRVQQPVPPSGANPPASRGTARLPATISAQGRDLSAVITVSPLVVKGGRGAAVVIEDSSGVEQAEQMRRDFVANVSHELRTPLTALMGFIDTLRGPARNDPAAQQRFLDIMAREAGRMNRLIADLLSLSRVESDERRRPAETVDLAGLIRSVAATMGPAARESGVTVTLHGTQDAVRLPGDHDQIVQVFHNLFENAIKYGGGQLTVTLRRIPHEPLLRGPGWAAEVADNGDGIEALHLPRLTERFYRVDTHRSREKGGTGLGLAIVKHIVARHRGRLKIDSEKGRGSRFTVILPETAASPAPPLSATARPDGNRPV
ncbi:sensor histidine kinase [Paracoccus luteus]|uniref:sensor histidine kinase n=1 Tax=Paracoccus luteus TaxID=2508543 RepID=UPI00106F77FE|nr:ATP-binding protein [Paracoccus luteus]